MKQYYSERNGLLRDNFKINLSELRQMFYDSYLYFYKKGAFKYAFYGIDGDTTKKLSPSMAPSPEVYLQLKTQFKKVFPIDDYYEKYDESTLFSIIEILYDHIGIYDYYSHSIKREVLKDEYSTIVNNFLKLYSEGYYLEPTKGFIMKIPNQALMEQLKFSNSDNEIPDKEYITLLSATKAFYSFDASTEDKKKAVCSLADILEDIRYDLQDILNTEYGTNKNKHDKLIFDVVNNFNFRHNNNKQISNYSTEIWYDWAMQYYTSVIITYYKLKYQKQ